MAGVTQLNRWLLVFACLILFFSFSFAVIKKDQMKVYAITSAGDAISADLILEVKPGEGKIYSALTSLVGTTTQAAERAAVKVASNYFKNALKYDYFFDINSPASLVEGPSAGAAMALLCVSMLRDQPLPENVSVTGTISLDGFVGPVGGVFEKTKAASETGVDLFLIPKGEAKQIVKIDDKIETINLTSYALEAWGIKVIEVETLDDVLKWAYSDIEEIDVEKIPVTEVEVFTPEAVEAAEQLKPMNKLTLKYINEAKELIEKAKTALSGTILEDQALIDVLLQTLNEGEEQLSEAELLYQRNYFYSAANYAYVSKVNAAMVKDIAENPSILKTDSTVFNLKVTGLKENLDSFKKELSKTVPLDGLEWLISAQQRLSYAENNIDRILSVETIVVENQEIEDKYTEAIKRIQDYEYAKGWHNIAKDLYDIIKDSNQLIDAEKLREEKPFAESIDDLIVQVEDGLTIIDEDDLEDVLRRLEAAKKEKKRGWHLAALTDAASALALVNSSITIKEFEEKDINALFSFVNQKIAELDQNIQESKYKFVWAQLYLDHAKYFQRSADHFYAENQALKTRQNLENAVGLVYLAEFVYLASKEEFDYFEEADLAALWYTVEGVAPPEKKPALEVIEATEAFHNLLLLLVGVVIGAVIVILFSATFYSRMRKARAHDIVYQIQHNKALQKQLDLAFASNKITEEKYDDLKQKLAEQLKGLEESRIYQAKKLMRVDELTNKIIGLNHMLRDLKHRHHQGLLSEQEYQEAFQSYYGEMAALRQELAKARKELKARAVIEAKPKEVKPVKKVIPKEIPLVEKEFLPLSEKKAVEKPKELLKPKKAKKLPAKPEKPKAKRKKAKPKKTRKTKKAEKLEAK